MHHLLVWCCEIIWVRLSFRCVASFLSWNRCKKSFANNRVSNSTRDSNMPWMFSVSFLVFFLSFESSHIFTRLFYNHSKSKKWQQKFCHCLKVILSKTENWKKIRNVCLQEKQTETLNKQRQYTSHSFVFLEDCL